MHYICILMHTDAYMMHHTCIIYACWCICIHVAYLMHHMCIICALHICSMMQIQVQRCRGRPRVVPVPKAVSEGLMACPNYWLLYIILQCLFIFVFFWNWWRILPFFKRFMLIPSLTPFPRIIFNKYERNKPCIVRGRKLWTKFKTTTL